MVIACCVGNVLYNLVAFLANGLAVDCFFGSSFKYIACWEDKVSDKCKLVMFYSFSTNCLFPYHLLFVNSFHTTQNQYMLFWLLKDA